MERERWPELGRWFVDRGVKHVLFDMDGTLVETRDHYRIRMREYCRFLSEESGMPKTELFDVFVDGVISLRSEFQVRPEVLNVPARVLAKMCEVSGPVLEEKIDELMMIYELPPKVFLGAVEQVRLIRNAGVETALVTHAGEKWTWKKMEEFRGLFGAWVCTPTDRPKDVVAWKEAMDGLGLSPGEVMVVGDSLTSDIGPALELGTNKVVWVGNGLNLDEEVDGVIKIETIAELAGGLLSN